MYELWYDTDIEFRQWGQIISEVVKMKKKIYKLKIRIEIKTYGLDDWVKTDFIPSFIGVFKLIVSQMIWSGLHKNTQFCWEQ